MWKYMHGQGPWVRNSGPVKSSTYIEYKVMEFAITIMRDLQLSCLLLLLQHSLDEWVLRNPNFFACSLISTNGFLYVCHHYEIRSRAIVTSQRLIVEE